MYIRWKKHLYIWNKYNHIIALKYSHTISIINELQFLIFTIQYIYNCVSNFWDLSSSSQFRESLLINLVLLSLHIWFSQTKRKLISLSLQLLLRHLLRSIILVKCRRCHLVISFWTVNIINNLATLFSKFLCCLTLGITHFIDWLLNETFYRVTFRI